MRRPIGYNGFIASLFLLFLCNFGAKSQDFPPEAQKKADSLENRLFENDTIPDFILQYADSLGLDSLQLDSLILADSVLIDSLTQANTPKKPVGDIVTTVHYQSRDSITLNVRTKIVDLYGQSNVDYEPIGLNAEQIKVDWNSNTMTAQGGVDSAGNEFGKPVFLNGSEVYETQNMKYNFKTRKAIISGLVTEQEGGYIHGDEVFKNAKNELFIPNWKYTTCNLSHPHFYIAGRKVKVIPDNKMVTGPFNMVVNDVPTPLGFAFGMFPDQKNRASGLIFPSYGEQKLKGFFLEDGGYFFAISDYINLRLTASLYSRGGYGVNVASQYIKRYNYRGNFRFNYTRQNLTSDVDTESAIAKDFRITWSHSPQSTGTGRLSASVNAATSTYNQNNVLESVNDQINTTLSSNVSYSKSFRGTPVTMGLNGRFNQNLTNNKVDLLLPEFNASVQNIYPFQSKTGGGNTWYDRLTFRYSINAVNKITNQIDTDSIAPFDFNTLPKLIENAQNGFKHNIPIGTSLKAFKHFTISPSFNYDELWYFEKLNHSYDSATNKIVTETIPGFNRVSSYNTSISMNTRIYGTYFFNREFGVQAIRHVLNPSISYSYRPDFGDPRFDYYQEVQSNANGDTRQLSRYTGFVYGAPRAGRSSSVSLGITNTLEMKTRSRKDTTGRAEKVALLRNFGVSTSYNFAADSFKLSSISLRATTDLLNNKEILNGSVSTQRTSINLSGTLDPYTYILDSTEMISEDVTTVYQRRIDKFAWQNGDGLGRFANVTFSLGSGLQAKPRSSNAREAPAQPSADRGSGRRGDVVAPPAATGVSELQNMINSGSLNYHEEAIVRNILDHPEDYVDFNVPWSLSFTYNLNFRKVGFQEGEVTQTVRFNGDLSLSEKWKVGFNSGYDIEKKEWTQTRFTLSRDLHCWEMNFDWVPFGRFTSYSFTIRAKSSLLQDLKLNRRRSFQDNIF